MTSVQKCSQSSDIDAKWTRNCERILQNWTLGCKSWYLWQETSEPGMFSVDNHENNPLTVKIIVSNKTNSPESSV